MKNFSFAGFLEIMNTFYINQISDITKSKIENLSIVLGFFDGCHLGHLSLINEAKKDPSRKIALFTFDKNIKAESKTLFSLESRIKLFETCGVDYLYIFKASESFKNTSYQDFIDKYLKQFNHSKFYLGSDYSFGKGGAGKTDDLIKSGLDIVIIPFVLDDEGKKLSSSTIRNLVENGEIEKANSYLSTEFFIEGKVKHGLNNGTKFILPTANIEIDDSLVFPKNGVYITKVEINEKEYIGITNIGTHPTIDALEKPIIETFILNFDENLYSKNIKIRFFKRLRDEKKFANIDELKNQIMRDKDQAINYFE